MSQAVSQRFLNAQAADSNKVASMVQLVLGNYCSAAAYGSTIAVGPTDGQTPNYPASGIIDGDRTEINVGPSSTADNDIGLSSYRSTRASNPSGTAIQMTITFSQARTINRLKLYHLSGHGLKSFSFTLDGVQIAATADRITNPTAVTVTTTYELDVINFPDAVGSVLVLSVWDTQIPADFVNVVELEAYRLVDITSRISATVVSRQRDFKLANPIAATVQLNCINTDRFFSVSHVPTMAEVAEGFVNSELQPGVGIIVQMGYDYYGAAPELVTVFTGEIDSLTIQPATRDAIINGRDLMKRLINNAYDSTKLKTGQDISTNIQYVLNRANVSDYEMALDQTGINIDYFFTEQQAQLDTIRDLTQAAGDALFYIDELGIATFKDYSSNIANQKLYTSQIDWESGALFNISTRGPYVDELAVPPQYFPDITAGAYTGSMADIGGLISLNNSSAFNGASFPTGAMQIFSTNIGGASTIGQTIAQPYNIPRAGTINQITVQGWEVAAGKTVQIQIWQSSGGIPLDPSGSPIYASSNFTGNQLSGQTVTPNLHVSAGLYFIVLRATSAGTFNISQAVLSSTAAGQGAYTQHGTTWAFLTISPFASNTAGLSSSFSFTYDAVSASGTFTSTWYDSGSISVNPNPLVTVAASYPSGTSSTIFLDGSDDGSTVAVTYSVNNLNGSTSFSVAQHEFWRLRVSATASDNVNVPTFGNLNLLFGASGTWTSPILDTGVNTISLGSIMATSVLNGGTISFQTRSSSNGITWSPYASTSGSGLILSPLARYLQTQVLINLGSGGVTPIILDITVGWTSGGGSLKYPATSSFDFSFDSSLLDVQQSLADNLGGDTSILNDIIVQAQPLVLTGTDADTVWQGTIGTPPTAISPSTPMTLANSTKVLVIPISVPGGMDISRMSGIDPAAVAVTPGTVGNLSWFFTSIHPTLPVLALEWTGDGTITDLRLIGKTFQNANYLLAQEATDAASINQYGDRQLSITNQFITSPPTAAAIASILLANYKAPTSYIPSAKVELCPPIQLGDRVTVNDINLDMTADYIVVGESHEIDASSGSDAKIESDLVLLKVPAGS